MLGRETAPGRWTWLIVQCALVAHLEQPEATSTRRRPKTRKSVARNIFSVVFLGRVEQ